AMANPLDVEAVDDLRFQSGCHIEAVVAPPSEVARGILSAYGGELPELLRRLERIARPAVSGEARVLEREARAAPIVRIVDHLLAKAVRGRASDIHIESHGKGSRVRFRVDGLLGTTTELPPGTHRAAISRVKIMAGLDISERRRPQDGGFTFREGALELTVRVSTIPTRAGEKAVLRILDTGEAPPDLTELGLAGRDLERLRSLLGRHQGVILAAGPTGSGKTTTLSAIVRLLSAQELNVITLEDPIEYRFPGVAQMEIDRRAGMGFPEGLRAILRQDPDVIMVGEIRDRETAEIAMSAAVTGHLVLSTIHTVDAPGAVVRLLEMGVPKFLVAGGLSGVVAQRLVRRICSRCMGRGKECPRCTDGLRGRCGVFEVLAIDDEIRTAVAAGTSISVLRSLARTNGMGSMGDDALRHVANGTTTPHEAGRILSLATGPEVPCGGCGRPVPPGAVGCPGCGLARRLLCGCGETLERRWRYCPRCLRPARAAA
ncbi:MAG: Flp pilus assembly complex ATPase component TadA, partial [Gemmatimonadetes bacterium]|nr:Flp pilus assembly complex ATPase component TadA [Gemmatimonadota bacterium]